MTENQRRKREQNSKYLLFLSPNLCVRSHNLKKSQQHLTDVAHCLTNAILFVPVQLIAGTADALKSTHGVLTTLLTTTIVHAAFVYI